MSTSDGGRSAVSDINNGENCRSDKPEDEDDTLRSRLGKFTIGDDTGNLLASANHRYGNRYEPSIKLSISLSIQARSVVMLSTLQHSASHPINIITSFIYCVAN